MRVICNITPKYYAFLSRHWPYKKVSAAMLPCNITRMSQHRGGCEVVRLQAKWSNWRAAIPVRPLRCAAAAVAPSRPSSRADLCPVGNPVPSAKGSGARVCGCGCTPPDREPQTAHQGISTGPVTAVEFASINVEIRTKQEKRVLYALEGGPL
jgi:hypothetical protein